VTRIAAPERGAKSGLYKIKNFEDLFESGEEPGAGRWKGTQNKPCPQRKKKKEELSQPRRGDE